MISGVVNGNLEATIRLLIRGPGGPEQEIEAVIDTGFNGFLTLSPALVRRLGLPASWTESGAAGQWEGRATGPLRGYPLMGCQWRTVETDAADTDALVGMSLLYRHSVYAEAVEGGQVVIEVLP
jgi:hypothetical protein